MFINAWSIDESIQMFGRLAKLAFKRRKVLNIPILSCIYKLLTSYLANSLYLVDNIEAALKEVFGTEKGILGYSHATSASTRVSSPIATIHDLSSYCIFTNYNSIRTQDLG
jgi:hypothetical protein